MKKIITVFVTMFLLGVMAHSQVNINGLTVDAKNGYRYQGTAPNNTILCGNGSFFVPSSTCGASATLYYQTVQLQSISRPQRAFLNFTGNFNVSDSGGIATLVDLASTISSNTTGNAATATSATTATSLAGSPSQCSGGNVSTGINTNGNANCTNTITQANQLTSTPSQCSGGQVATGVAANGNANCTSTTNAPIPGTIHDVTFSRSVGVGYTNTNAFMIYVSGYFTTGGSAFAWVSCTVNGTTVSNNQFGATTNGLGAGFYCMVPAGATYVINRGGSASYGTGSWIETDIN